MTEKPRRVHMLLVAEGPELAQFQRAFEDGLFLYPREADSWDGLEMGRYRVLDMRGAIAWVVKEGGDAQEREG